MARNGHGKPTPVVAYRRLRVSPPAKSAPTTPAARVARNGRTSVVTSTFSLCPHLMGSPSAASWGPRKRQSPTLATSQLTSRTLMTDQYRSQWPEVTSAHPQPSFLQPPASQGYSPGLGYFVAPPRSDYATWAQRVRARLIDQGPTYLGLIIFYAGYLLSVIELSRSSGSTPDFDTAAVAMIIGLSVILASLAWVAYNRWMIAGKTGQSLG